VCYIYIYIIIIKKLHTHARARARVCMCVCMYTDFRFSCFNYHFSSAPSTLRSGIFGIFLFKYADDILSSA